MEDYCKKMTEEKDGHGNCGPGGYLALLRGRLDPGKKKRKKVTAPICSNILKTAIPCSLVLRPRGMALVLPGLIGAVPPCRLCRCGRVYADGYAGPAGPAYFARRPAHQASIAFWAKAAVPSPPAASMFLRIRSSAVYICPRPAKISSVQV